MASNDVAVRDVFFHLTEAEAQVFCAPMEGISIQNLNDSLAVGLDFDSLLVKLSEFKQDSAKGVMLP